MSINRISGINSSNINTVDGVIYTYINKVNGINFVQVSPTPSLTPGLSPSPTPSITPSSTVTPSITPSNTVTPSVTITPSNTVTPTISITPSNTVTPTISITPSNTVTPTISITPSNTVTPSITITPTISITPSNTVTPTISITPSNTATPSNTVTPSNTATPSNTVTPSVTTTPSNTVTPSVTTTPTISITPSTTLTPTVTPSSGGGGGEISLSDITHTCYPNPTWNQTTPLSFDLPTTAIVGDLVFLFIQTDNISNSDYIMTPSGWNKEFGWYGSTSDNSGNLYWKIMTSGDISTGSVDVYATTIFNRDGQAWTWIAENVDTTTPVSDVGVWTQSAGISKTIAGITPSADGLALGFWGFDGGDGEPTTITSGWTKLAEEECDGTSSGTFGGFASIPTTNGVGTGNLVVTALVSDGWGGVIINLKQSGPSVTPSVTPTISITPSVTPTISITPSITPTTLIPPTYEYYRFYAVDSSGNPTSAYIMIVEAQLYEGSNLTGTKHPTENLTSDTSFTGVTITKGYQYSTSYASWEAFDGNTTTVGSAWWTLSNSVAADNWLGIQFNEGPQQIGSIRFYISDNFSNADGIKIYGSDTGSFSGEENLVGYVTGPFDGSSIITHDVNLGE